MTYLPKTQEAEYQRQLRILKEQVDRVTADVERQARERETEVKLPDPKEAIPEAVKAAFQFVGMYQATTQPHIVGGGGGVSPFGFATEPVEPVCFERHVDPEEQATFGSACQLLADYFDRHNSRVLRARADAQRQRQLTDETRKPRKKR